MKENIVIGSTCPNCQGDLDGGLHTLWEQNLNRKTVQEEIKKNGRNRFAPFGFCICPHCKEGVSIQLYGDFEGFNSFLFKDEEDRKFFCKQVLEPMVLKGVSPKAMHLAINKIFGTKAEQGVLLVPKEVNERN